MRIEEAYSAHMDAIHDYANAAHKVDTGQANRDDDLEPFEKVEDTARALALAVLDEAVAEFERHGHAQVDHLRRQIEALLGG